MSHTDLLLAAFRNVAARIRDDVDEKGFKVDLAMSVDDDFESGQARAMLMRDLVIGSASREASRSGVIDFRPVNGSGRELRTEVGSTQRRYRIRRARRVGDDLVIMANSDSALVMEDPDDVLFGAIEQWVLGWVLDDHDKISDVFLARVLRSVEDGRRLPLGPITPLLDGKGDASTRFTPNAPGGLPGFDLPGTDDAPGEEGQDL